MSRPHTTIATSYGSVDLSAHAASVAAATRSLDAPAIEILLELAEDVGFDPILSGTLEMLSSLGIDNEPGAREFVSSLSATLDAHRRSS